MRAPVAIVAAMQEELGALLAAMPDEQRVRIAGRDFWAGHLQGQPVVAVLSRIGKVAAATTATVLLERFGVCAIVFTGVADEKTGEAVKLVIVKKNPDLTEAQVREYCRANLTGYKQPRVIEFRTDLPKTPVGKILRRELRDAKK